MPTHFHWRQVFEVCGHSGEVGARQGEGARVILMPVLQVRILNRVSDLDVRQDGSLRNVPPVDVVTCLQDNKVTVDSE